METTLLTAGIACVVAAVIGGGLKAFGIEIRLLESFGRQVLLAVLGVVLILSAVVMKYPGLLRPQDASQRDEPVVVEAKVTTATVDPTSAPPPRPAQEGPEPIAKSAVGTTSAAPSAEAPPAPEPPVVTRAANTHELIFKVGAYDFGELAKPYQVMVETAANDIKRHSAKGVLVTAYDATGSGSDKAASRRATSGANMLAAQGVDRGLIEVKAHGKTISKPLETDERGPRWVVIDIQY